MPSAAVNTWLSRRSVGLGVVALVLMVAMTLLGLWQLSVFDDRQQRDSAEQLRREPVPLADILGPDDAFPSDAVGRPVLVTGRYDVKQQVYVEGLPGHDGAYAVATPLIDDTGAAILVVRGSSDRAGVASPTGPVTVEGVLEPTTAGGGTADPQHVVEQVRIPALVQAFDTDLYSGYVVLRSSNPPESLPQVDPPIPDTPLLAGLRNLAYALQWWVFAAFVAFMWWRAVRGPMPVEPTQRADCMDEAAGPVG